MEKDLNLGTPISTLKYGDHRFDIEVPTNKELKPNTTGGHQAAKKWLKSK